MPEVGPDRHLSPRDWGACPMGRAVTEYTLDNGRGLSFSVPSTTAASSPRWCPDRDGRPPTSCSASPSVAGYLERNPHFGAIIGRYANRIADGRFTLDGACAHSRCNEAPNALHGGPSGFDRRWWASSRAADARAASR